MKVMQMPPPDSFELLPLKGVLVLDPWVDPLPLPGPLPTVNLKRPSLAIINSEGFTLWRNHFQLLKDIVLHWKVEAKAPTTLMTIGEL